MNWDAIGAIGEILGALAVVLTLMYLARQVSEAKNALYLQSTKDSSSLLNEYHALVASSTALASMMAKSISNEEQDLDSGQVLQVQAAMQIQLNSWETMYRQAVVLGDTQRLATVRKALSQLMEYEFIREAWSEHRMYVTEDFREFVDALRN